MASPDEIQRIAQAMNAVRPDWRVTSLVTFLTRHHAGRPYRDLAIAAVAVATDTRTQTPELLNQHGPWWVAAQAAFAHVDDHRFTRCPEPGHGSFPAWNCSACRAEEIADTHGRSERPDPNVPDPAVTAAGAALVRTAMREAGITPTPRSA